MKVKCTKIFNEHEKKFVESNPWLTIGREYIVLEIDLKPGKDTLYRLLNDDKDNRSGLHNAIQFQVVSGKLPPNWQINQRESGSLVLGPVLWRQLGFWEDFYDGNFEAIEIYKKEVIKILKEEGIKDAEEFQVGEVEVINLHELISKSNNLKDK